MKRKRTLSLFSMLLLGFFSCKKENDFDKLKTEAYNPSIAAPLIDTESSVEEVMSRDSGGLSTNEEGTVQLHYAKRLFSFKGEDLFDIPDLSSQLFDDSTFLKFSLAYGRQLEKLLLKGGTLDYSYQNDDTNEVSIEIELPYATKGGAPFKQTIVVPPGGYVSGTFDLSGYEFDLTLGGSDVNSILILQTVTDLVTGQDLTGDDPLNIQLRDLLFRYIEGYLGKYDFDISSDTIPVRFFEQWVQGTVEFSDPQLALRIQNEFGFPITGELNTVEAFSGQSKEPLNTSNSAQDTFSIDFPGLGSVGEGRSTSFFFNNGNSNIGSMISIFPEGIRTDLAMTANLASDTTQTNFIMDESELNADMELTLPMEGRIDDVLLRDTMNMASRTEDRFRQLRSARFKLLTRNELPLELNVQIFLADEKHQVLDSLIHGGRRLLGAAEPAPLGDEEAVEERSRIEYSPEGDLSDVDRMILEVGVNSFNSGQDTVALRAAHRFGIKLGMIADLNAARE